MADKTKAIEFLRGLDASHGLPKGTLENIWNTESGQSFSPDTTSSAGAKGAFQFMPATAREYGVNTADFKSSAEGAARYLKDSMREFNGDLNSAIASYNAGIGRVARTPFEALPYETRNYVQKVTQGMATGSLNRMLALAEKDPKAVPLETIKTVLAEYDQIGGAMDDNQTAILERLAPRYEALQPKETPVTPTGSTTIPVKPSTFLEQMGQGVKDIGVGMAQVADIPASLSQLGASGISKVMGAITGEAQPTQFEKPYSAVDALNKAVPDIADKNKITSMLTQGVASAIPTLPLVGTGSIASRLLLQGVPAKTVAMELASGGLGQVGAEVGNEAGGTAGGIIGGIAGGITPYALSGILKGSKQALLESTRPAAVTVEQLAREIPVPEAMAKQIDPKMNGTAFIRNLNDWISTGAKVKTTPQVLEGEIQSVVDDLLKTTKVSPEAFAEAGLASPIYTPSPVTERLISSREYDIPLTAGELLGGSGRDAASPYLGKATKLQSAEANLRATGQGEQVQAALQFKEIQKQKIVDAAQKFTDDQYLDKSTPEVPLETSAQRGEYLRKAVSDEKGAAKKAVNDLYEASKNVDAPFNVDASKMVKTFADEAVLGKLDDSTLKGLNSLLAKYGLKGTTDNVLDDVGQATVTLADGSKVKTVGKVEPLTLNNVEDFRQGLNSLYDYTKPRSNDSLRLLKGNLDDAVDVVLNAPVNPKSGKQLNGAPNRSDVVKVTAFTKAREAYKAFVESWKAKDLLQKILDTKAGTKTNVLADEKVGSTIFNAPEEYFQKIMSVIKKDPIAYEVVKVDMLSSLFDKAAVRDVAGNIESISGAKLKTAISKFNTTFPDRLSKTIKNYNQFERLVNLIEDATIPLKYTQNPSGTAYKLIESVSKLIPTMLGLAKGGLLGAIGGNLIADYAAFLKAQKVLAPMLDQKKLVDTYAKELRKSAVPPPMYDAAMEQYVVKSGKVIENLIDFGEVTPTLLGIRLGARALAQATAKRNEKK
jgi:hypothetical protein